MDQTQIFRGALTYKFKEDKGSTYCNLQKQKIGSSAKTRLTYGKYLDTFPAFTPNGKRVVFSSNRTGSNLILWIVSAEGPGGIAMLTHTLAEDFSPSVSQETNNNLVVFEVAHYDFKFSRYSVYRKQLIPICL